MLWNASRVIGYAIQATDGEIGAIDDFFVDDSTWAIRWVVVDTGSWLPGRRVLLPPSQLHRPSAPDRNFAVNLTRQQVKDSPDADTDKPVSRQHEERLYAYYAWEPYWLTAGAAPLGGITQPVVPPLYAAGSKPGSGDVESGDRGDPHLRSVREITGYALHATDGEIGEVHDVLLDTDDWHLRYFVVDTGRWLPGKQVLIAPHWISDISWDEREVRTNLSRDQVKHSPEYDPAKTVDRAYEVGLYSYYGSAGYWI